MIVKNIYILIITAVLSFVSNHAMSQENEDMNLELNSLSNESVRVNVELDDVNDRITLKLNSKEMLCLNDYRGLEEDMKILGNKFIVIQYRTRGGSGVKVRKTALICISNGKFCKALDVLSTESYEFKDTYDKATDSLKLYNESGLCTLRLVDLQNEGQGFMLHAIQYEKVKSKFNKRDNYEKTDTIKFCFDENNKVFYTTYLRLEGNYKIEGEMNSQRFFKGQKYPSIDLKNNQYIFIDNVWYNKMRDNHLAEISGSCK